MNGQSLEQLYSSKTDDELLALSADEGSLREEAKQILIRELQRRGLDAGSVANDEVKNTRISGTRRTNMKTAAVISFIVAIVLGIAAIGPQHLDLPPSPSGVIQITESSQVPCDYPTHLWEVIWSENPW